MTYQGSLQHNQNDHVGIQMPMMHTGNGYTTLSFPAIKAKTGKSHTQISYQNHIVTIFNTANNIPWN